MRGLDRRRFLELASCGACAVLSGCGGIAFTQVTPVRGLVRLSLEDFPALADPDGYARLRLTDGNGTTVYVLSMKGGYAAVSPVCTHRGCTVNVAGAHLRCPCHGSVYDREGQVLRGPAERALRRYDLEVTADGEILIRVEAGA